jgi:hypothetical protein
MLENDLGLGDRSHVSSNIPKRRGGTSWKAVQLEGSGIASLSDYMQQSRENFVSYGVFLSSYWENLPQSITRRLGENLWVIYEHV